MFLRAGRASILDRKPFTEAFFDGDATADAAIVVSIVATATYLIHLFLNSSVSAFSVQLLLQLVIAAVVSWLILGFATWFAATKLFGASGRPQTMLALQGLAVLPLILDAFGSIASTVALVWYLVVLVVGTREAADLTLRNAAVSVLIGFALAVVFRALLGAPFAVFNAIFS
jgi:hypothetical protein